jgi:hypothetical protein
MDFVNEIREPSSLEDLNIFLGCVDSSPKLLSLIHPELSKLNGLPLLPIEAARFSPGPLSTFGFAFAACKKLVNKVKILFERFQT